MTRSRKWRAAVVGVAIVAAHPAQAQQSEAQIELYSEMLALGGVCSQLEDYHVDVDPMIDALNERLEELDDDAIDAVFARRDTKVQQLTLQTQAARDSQGMSRDRVLNAHYASMMTRCRRLTNNDFAERYFNLR